MCVLPDQQTACTGLEDGATCETGFEGTCHDGVCLPIGCGNGEIDDPVFGTSEQCDDHNRVGHDGCSSSCRIEVPAWDDLTFPPVPMLSEQGMVFDTSRDVLMMFGGAEYGVFQGAGVWDLDKIAWGFRRRSVLAPTTRLRHAMANDGRRNRVVMFGGRSGRSILGDTWEWNGIAWTPMPVGPPAREEHAMAYDPIRGVTVLFGGRNGTVTFDDTWEWDGSSWTLRDLLPTRPPPLVGHAMAFDPQRGVVVVVGQSSVGTVETWELDGETWHDVTPGGPRPPRARGIGLAYDTVARELVLTGAVGAAGEAQTWAWDGFAWSVRAVGTAAGIYGGASATDPIDGRVIMFGGRTDPFTLATAIATTSRWTGTSWVDVSPLPMTPPAGRSLQAAALDLHRGRIVMFGGLVAGATAETWELGPERWTSIPSSGPTARARHAMAYDAARRRTVMVGGVSEAATWLWDGSTWSSVAGAVPPGCSGAAMTFDVARGAVVLFGGQSCTPISPQTSARTWEWRGAGWTVMAPPISPSARTGHMLAYDPIRERVILFGGTAPSGTVLADTWEWNGTTWTELHPTSIPSARDHGALVWDGARRRLVLFGGVVAGAPAEDIWEWDGTSWIAIPVLSPLLSEPAVGVGTLDGAGVLALSTTGGLFAATTLVARRLRLGSDGPYEACRRGDHDGDGLRGCADLDCWMSCSPVCPPGAPCAADAARCGDSMCSALESCLSCPEDCGACPARCGDLVCSQAEDCPGDCAW